MPMQDIFNVISFVFVCLRVVDRFAHLFDNGNDDIFTFTYILQLNTYTSIHQIYQQLFNTESEFNVTQCK